MAETLHIRRSFQMEGATRWAYWSVVRVSDEGEVIIASTEPLRVPPPALPHEHLMLTPGERLPRVPRFEYESKLEAQGHKLVERLQAEGWEPAARDAQGMVIRMTR